MNNTDKKIDELHEMVIENFTDLVWLLKDCIIKLELELDAVNERAERLDEQLEASHRETDILQQQLEELKCAMHN